MFVVGLDLHVLDNIALITNTLIDIAKKLSVTAKESVCSNYTLLRTFRQNNCILFHSTNQPNRGGRTK